jgi:signal transduction histidine kinase
MNATLLLTDSAETRRGFADLLAGRTSLIPVVPPADPSRERFDALFATWLRLVDLVVVDGVALGQMTRWAVESLTQGAQGNLPVVIRLKPAQRGDCTLPEHWLVVLDTDSPEQLRQSFDNFFELHATKARLRRAPARPQAEPTRMTTTTPMESYRYRDALKNLSRLLGQRHRADDLPAEFLRLVRELLGVGKLAIFTRPLEGSLFAGGSTPTSDQLAVACSHGVALPVTEHLRLTLDAGIGGYLTREVRILRRREAADDGRIEREFELLGTEVAVPMFDNDQLLGVLTFSGKITGESMTNEELELVYQLASQFSQAMRNVQLSERVASQQRLMVEVLAHVHSGVLVIDQDERILAINDRLRALLELGAEPLTGKELGRIPGRVADVVFEVLSGGDANRDQEVMLPRTNRPLRVRATRFEETDTGKAVVVALVEDLTQEKLELAREREMADKEFLMRLAFRLSHELKNSLVSIKIFAQLLPERYEEKDFRDQFSGVVANEVNRVDVLVNNLTFFSHPLVLVHDDVVLTELLDSCVKNVGNEFARKQLVQIVAVGDKASEPAAGVPVVTLKKNFAHKLARLEGDKLRLMQAFEHVLRNALQAMPVGGRLSMSTSDAQASDYPGGHLPAGGAVKIEFQDSGEGIGLENLPRVMEPFVTSRNVGVGLGLTIVKKIVERHSGRVEVDSLLGRSTTVTVVLPVKTQPHPEDVLLQDMANRASADDVGESGAAADRLPKSLRQEHGERS